MMRTRRAKKVLAFGVALGSALMIVGFGSGLTQIHSALAASETFEYDALGRLKSSTFSDGSQAEYEYDAAGNRTSRTVSGSSQSEPPTAVVVLPISGFTIIPLYNTQSVVTGN